MQIYLCVRPYSTDCQVFQMCTPTLDRCICEQQEIVFLCMEEKTFQNIFFLFFHQIRCLFKIYEHSIFLSNDWGYFQWVFRYHWKGLICNLPIGTVFSRDPRMPINQDSESCQTVGWTFYGCCQNEPFFLCG